MPMTTLLKKTSPIKNPKQLAPFIEHTLLTDSIDDARITSHCLEARTLDVLGVCVPMAFVPLAKKLLSGTDKLVITVIDFPKGKKSSTEKAAEAYAAEALGVDEIDMVLDYQALIEKDYNKALADISAVVKNTNVAIKVIGRDFCPHTPTACHCHSFGCSFRCRIY